MNARRMTASLQYNGHDISAELAPLLVNVTYTDNAGERADELSVTTGDLDLLWGGRWTPTAGDTLTCTLIGQHWYGEGKHAVLPCGSFEICADTQELESGQYTVRATSVPLSLGIRRQRRNRAWEHLPLRAIAQQIAQDSGLTLLYDAPVNPTFERRDQQYHSDLAFLQQLAGQFGIRVKLRPPMLILFDEARYEARPAAVTITAATPISGGSIERNYDEVYAACVVEYHKPDTGKEGLFATYTPPHPLPVADVLRVNERVETAADAELLARARLREHNRQAYTGSLALPFEPSIVGATVFASQGRNRPDDGRYFVDRVTHSTADARSTVDFHRCLEGY